VRRGGAAGARLRSLVLGVALGVAPLLLLDLATELARVADATSAWWTIAAYALIGGTIAAAVLGARRDPLIPALAALVLLLAVAPGLPDPLDAMPLLPVIGEVAVAQTPVIVVLAAVCAVGAVRGRAG
jgi:energy-converting hydrogenase Eha subunit E